MKLALRVLGLLIGAVIMALLIDQIGLSEILGRLREAGPGFVWILVLHAAAIVVAAIPWWVLLSRDTRPSMGAAIASRFVAQGANAVLPLFGLGGELVRLLYLRRGQRAAGVAAITVDRLMYAGGSVTLLGLGLVAVTQIEQLPREYTRTAAIGVGVLLAAIAVGMLLATRYRMAGRLDRLVRRMRRQLKEDARFGDEVDREIRRMLTWRARAPYLAWGMHFVSRALIGAEIAVAFWLLGVPLGFDEALVFAALPIMLAVTGLLVPNQLGVHEGANAVVASSLDIDPAIGVAVVLLLRMRQIVGVAVVAVLVAVKRSSLPREPLPAQP